MYTPGDRVRVIFEGALFTNLLTDNATVIEFSNGEYTVIVDHPEELAELEGDTVQAERYIHPDKDGIFSSILPIDDVPQPRVIPFG